MRRRASASVLVLAAALATSPMAARGQATTITPDVGASLSLGTTALRTGNVVTIDGGTLSGANLFHSFSQFSLVAGDVAQWVRAGGGAGVNNVINRVTGGEVSQIAGTLDSTTLPNANFYFINPAGVVFGAGARVNVPAAAWFSTADELRFADGQRFSMATPGGSTLSVAAPGSFGFVGGQGAIRVTGAAAGFAPTSAALSFVGSDVAVANSQIILRGLDLVAVGDGQATVLLADPLASIGGGAVQVSASQFVVTPDGALSGPLRIGGGDITLDASLLVSDSQQATRGGEIRIAAGRLHLTGSQIGASARGVGAGGAVSLTAGDIDGQGGSLFTVASAQGAGGRLSISAGGLHLSGVTLSSNSTADGAGGDIELTAQTLSANASYAISNALGAGAGGSVRITAPSMELVNAIAVSTASGGGRPGDVSLTGGEIVASGGVLGSSPGLTSATGNLTINASTSFEAHQVSMTADTYGATGGSISITSPVVFLDGGLLDSASFGDGSAGSILIQAGRLTIDHSQLTAEARGTFRGSLGLVQLKATGDILLNGAIITSSAYGEAHGGVVTIEGRDVRLDDARVQSDSFGDGPGGRVSIKGDSLTISNGAVSSNASQAGDAGDVSLDGRVITLDTSAKVSSDTLDAGRGGAVTIRGGQLLVTDGASITSKATGGTGDAGSVTVEVDSLTLTDASISSDTESFGKAGAVVIHTGDLLVGGSGRGLTFISSDTLGSGNAGGVTIDAKSIVVRAEGSISSNSFADGAAGRVTIRTGSLVVRDGGFIASDANGLGHAGDVSINADSLLLEGDGDNITYISSDSLGGGDAGAVTIDARAVKVNRGGFISSDTYAFGEAGDVTIRAGALSLDTNGNIRSGTFSNGGAGNVSVQATSLSLANGAAISSEAYAGSVGGAGVVSIASDSLAVGDQARVSTSSGGAGDAGAVTIKAKTLSVDGGLVSSAAVAGATGGSGALSITADAVSLVNGGSISTVSNNDRRAGQIGITAGVVAIDGAGSGITSENQAGNTALGNRRGQSGAAGAIRLTAKGLTVANGGRISTNAFSGAAGEIEIAMPAGSLLTLKGAVAPGFIETSSGSGTGGRITIGAPLAIVSNGGSILALGELRGANVAIQTQYFINSADRINTVAVDGAFRLVATTNDVSSGTVTRDLSVLDASKILRGQCPVTRSTGVVSQLVTRPVGPYVREPAFEVLQHNLDSLQLGVRGCR